jgi:hypothetical protein
MTYDLLRIFPILLTNYNKTLDMGYVLLYCYNKCKCCSIPHHMFTSQFFYEQV